MEEGCYTEFKELLKLALGLPDDWESTTEVVRKAAKKVAGISS